MVVIENILEGQRCVEKIPGNSVENTLYRTGGWKYKSRDDCQHKGSKHK